MINIGFPVHNSKTMETLCVRVYASESVGEYYQFIEK